MVKLIPVAIFLLVAAGVLALEQRHIEFVQTVAAQTANNSTSPRATGERTVSPQLAGKDIKNGLYIVDSNQGQLSSRVLLIDPQDKRVLKTFNAGLQPDIAVSPDGTRLYLAFTEYQPDRMDKLQVIDTSSGAVLQTVENPERWLGTAPRYASKMAISSDGRRLYIYKDHQTTKGDFYYLATFDTEKGKFLPETVALPGCLSAILVPLAEEGRINVLCTGMGDVRFLNVSESGAAAVSRIPLRQSVAKSHGRNIGYVIPSRDGQRLAVVMGDGTFYNIDNKDRKVLRTGEIQNEAPAGAKVAIPDGLIERWIGVQPSTVSVDGSEAYVGVGYLENLRKGNRSFDEVAVLDTQNLKIRRVLQTSRPITALYRSKEGRYLYGLAQDDDSILVIDTATGGQVDVISGLVRTPTLLVNAP